MKIKDAVKRNFSRYAAEYDAYSRVQNQAGLELLTYLCAGDFKRILDIGCGTGNFTWFLKNKFPTATIKAVDICDDMIRVARQKLRDQQIELVVADAEKMSLAESFDLIASNACFQWFDNLEKAMAEYKRLLVNNGVILFSIFGPVTFSELRKSLSRLFDEEVQLTSDTFADVDRLSSIMRTHFGEVSIVERIVKQEYGSLLELLHTIKYTGTQGEGLNKINLGKSRLHELERIYKRKFNTITATYQVFYCRGKRKD